MRNLVLIAHNIRSCHNVGSLLRTADGIGVKEVYLTGYTPYPKLINDKRLPHITNKIDRQIHKTALGAELTQKWHYNEDIENVISALAEQSYDIVALEQDATSVSLPEYAPDNHVALIIGRETYGIEKNILNLCDTIVEIPMLGKKESLNVVQASAMAMYHLRYFSLS
jgi:23S rRNA (guanosine2251-2'-O)-methyltransferase